MLRGTNAAIAITIRCDQTTPGCRARGQYAHMNPTNRIMNVCDRFFDDNLRGTKGEDLSLKSTSKLLGDCGSNFDLRIAQRARAATIIHECTHTPYAMNGEPCDDYAYGFIGCSLLPRGTFNRACAPYARANDKKCVNAGGGEGFCNGDISTKNADTYAFVAGGVFFEQRCGRPVPFPPLPAGVSKRSIEAAGVANIQTSRSARRAPQVSREVVNANRHSNGVRQAQNISNIDSISELRKGKRQTDSCPIMDDYLVIDGDENAISVTGYVHFGDSYASGMGTGTTSSDSCRVGSNNCESLQFMFEVFES